MVVNIQHLHRMIPFAGSTPVQLNEKLDVETQSLREQDPKKPSRFFKAIQLLVIILTVSLASLKGYLFHLQESECLRIGEEVCPIGQTIRPTSFNKDNSTVEYIIHNPDFREISVKKLAGAVKIPTVSQDNSPDPLDSPESYKEFQRFHRFLEAQFPSVYQHLKVEKFHVYSLLFTWEGSDPSLKPLLLTGHQDVVPVDEDTKDRWIHEPYSGYFDGENIWGRGSSDCKSLVVGLLQSLERLIADGFEPTRTVLVGFGFDEEIGGPLGASAISEVLLDRYGPDSIFALVDEGGTAISIIDDVAFALPSIGEKGSLNLDISLTTPGGHSSVPPDHTNIGIVAKVIQQIEDNAFEPVLSKENPTLGYLQCVAKYTNEFPKALRKSVFRAAYDKVANSKVLKYLDNFKAYKFLVRTTQAIDIIHGGVKSNALPEFTKITVNHRIGVESSIEFTTNKITNDVKTIADEFGLGLFLDGKTILSKADKGYFNITSGPGLKPAPVSPTTGLSWRLFAGSIKHIIEDYIYTNLTSPAVVAGNLNTGNTDTNRYLELTRNVYRYRFSTLHGILEGGTHSVNEHTTIDDQLYLIAFYYEYIRSVSEFTHDD